MMRYNDVDLSRPSPVAGGSGRATGEDRPACPVNLLESEVGEEVKGLLSQHSLGLTSGHQAWLLMAVLYLVERERRKAASKAREEQPALRLVTADTQ